MQRLTTLSLSVFLVLAAACKKEEGKPPEPAKPAAPTTPAGLVNMTFTFGKGVKISVDVPPGTAPSGDLGEDTILLITPDESFETSISLVEPQEVKTFAEDKDFMDGDPDCKFAKAEEFPDGWVLDNVCTFKDSPPQHFIRVKKKSGDKWFQCVWENLKSDAKAESTIRSCKTIKLAN